MIGELDPLLQTVEQMESGVDSPSQEDVAPSNCGQSQGEVKTPSDIRG
jgi:hypothetical protein